MEDGELGLFCAGARDGAVWHCLARVNGCSAEWEEKAGIALLLYTGKMPVVRVEDCLAPQPGRAAHAT
jgi:hypothetical protein